MCSWASKAQQAQGLHALPYLEQGLANALTLILGQHKKVQDAERLAGAVGVAAIPQEQALAPRLQETHQTHPAATCSLCL